MGVVVVFDPEGVGVFDSNLKEVARTRIEGHPRGESPSFLLNHQGGFFLILPVENEMIGYAALHDSRIRFGNEDEGVQIRDFPSRHPNKGAAARSASISPLSEVDDEGLHAVKAEDAGKAHCSSGPEPPVVVNRELDAEERSEKADGSSGEAKEDTPADKSVIGAGRRKQQLLVFTQKPTVERGFEHGFIILGTPKARWD